ncbi:FAD binding domain-containing protein [Segnochrobactrum spirostomi]|uniref:FAD-binding molybdopterin dehydrogenase n=1 Tax=Segnochrobactrum spirostomi TaxID=2608987 RepID=A0A6A7YC41_9HYPH|nr:FAD binding domain-containing protein [Segnochrobactrum spirostomi]MQT15551.1 FAD-binding molybdopterin dehydrogenase [Segnochrobactrum spirostomi]
MTVAAHGSLLVPSSLDTAIAALTDLGEDGAPFAGGTWIMRAPIRHEARKATYVALGRIAELREITITPAALEIGAGVTHAALASAITTLDDLRGLAAAAGRSANPAVRAAATVGGNLCTVAFAAADLVPALLCLDAEVEIAGAGGRERMMLEAFLVRRGTLAPGHLLTRIIVPRHLGHSAHARLPLRKAGDYPVAIVSLRVACDPSGRVREIRIAVGAVEPVARRWPMLEATLTGERLDPESAAERAAACLDAFTGRDGIEAPGWYRVHILPTLFRRAVAAASGS